MLPKAAGGGGQGPSRRQDAPQGPAEVARRGERKGGARSAREGLEAPRPIEAGRPPQGPSFRAGGRARRRGAPQGPIAAPRRSEAAAQGRREAAPRQGPGEGEGFHKSAEQRATAALGRRPRPEAKAEWRGRTRSGMEDRRPRPSRRPRPRRPGGHGRHGGQGRRPGGQGREEGGDQVGSVKRRGKAVPDRLRRQAAATAKAERRRYEAPKLEP